MAFVLCMSSNHPQRQSIVGALARDREGRWRPRASNTSDGEGESVFVFTTDPGPIPDEQRGLYNNPEIQHARRRQTLTCPDPKCGANVMARGEKLDAILDDFWRAAEGADIVRNGVFNVPLGILAARVVST